MSLSPNPGGWDEIYARSANPHKKVAREDCDFGERELEVERQGQCICSKDGTETGSEYRDD